MIDCAAFQVDLGTLLREVEAQVRQADMPIFDLLLWLLIGSPIVRGGGDFLPSPLWLIEGHRKIGNNYSQKWNCAASFAISAFMYLWTIYIFPRSVRLFYCITFADRSWEYINRSQTHECSRNWEFHFLGLFVSNFRYSAFAVYLPSIKTGTYLVADWHIELDKAVLHTKCENWVFFYCIAWQLA
jgi:hypothetical protein